MPVWISPHFDGGSGLKPPHPHGMRNRMDQISPHFDGGSGLKHKLRHTGYHKHGEAAISPHFDGGSGLKPRPTGVASSSAPVGSPLTSMGGAD